MCDGGSAARDGEFEKNVAQVAIDCTRANGQLLGDLAITIAQSHQRKYLSFTMGEARIQCIHGCLPFLVAYPMIAVVWFVCIKCTGKLTSRHVPEVTFLGAMCACIRKWRATSFVTWEASWQVLHTCLIS